jgi:3-dehydroquinate synthase
MSDVEFTVKFRHRLRFTHNCFDPANGALLELLEPSQENTPASVQVFLDENLARCHPNLQSNIERFADIHAGRMKLAGQVICIKGGEELKSGWSQLEPILKLLDRARLCRHSYAIAIGGGAVLDTVGLAASLFHRGVRLIRIASTTLSQADSGVGVKNGINAFGKKNALGIFTCPWAVINDEGLLSTLSEEDWRSGFAEVVKIALLKDAGLFAEIESRADQIAQRNIEDAIPFIRQSAQMHFDHIVHGEDPFELRHSRPLDFGHWAAHKLEKMSDFKLRHGEAVALGIALDVTYAKRMALLQEEACQRVVGCLNALGFTLNHPLLRESDELLSGLEEFREHLGGPLTVPMVRDIGAMTEIHDIDTSMMREVIEQFFFDRGVMNKPVSAGQLS